MARVNEDTSPLLIVGPAWVGDMVMAASLTQRLRQIWPDRAVDILAPKATLPVTRFIPGVRAGIEMDQTHGRFGLAARWRMGRQLRQKGYGGAIILPRSWKSALVPFFAHIPHRIGYWGEARWGLINRPRRLDKQALPRTVDRFVALGERKGAAPQVSPPLLHVTDQQCQDALARFMPRTSTVKPLLALCPGAEYGPAKQWPADKVAALAAQAMAKGWRVCLLGGPKDEAIGAAISHVAPGVLDLTGKTSLDDAIALIAAANCVVSNDSGLMHVAAALGRPQVAVFGSSSAAHTPPLNPKAQVISRQLDCQPCFKRVCPLGHLNCLNQIEAAEVMAAIGEVAAP